MRSGKGGQPRTILCAGALPDHVGARLATMGAVVTTDTTDEGELAAAAAGAAVIVARANAPLTATVIDAASGLQVVARSGTGTDNVDLQAATARGIPVVVTPDAGTDAVAEGAVAMLCALGKRLTQLTALTRDGRWADRDQIGLLDIAGSRVGVVGYGRIGRRVAHLMRALGAEVTFFDPYVTAEDALDRKAGSVAEVLSGCPFVSLHLPLTDETRGVVDRDLLQRCRPGSVLVNTSRGALVRSLDDLADALDAGWLGGVGLDVYAEEPPDQAHRLFLDPRVIATPHLMALSPAGRARIYDDMCSGIEAVLAGRRAPVVANPDVYRGRAKEQ